MESQRNLSFSIALRAIEVICFVLESNCSSLHLNSIRRHTLILLLLTFERMRLH